MDANRFLKACELADMVVDLDSFKNTLPQHLREAVVPCVREMTALAEALAGDRWREISREETDDECAEGMQCQLN